MKNERKNEINKRIKNKKFKNNADYFTFLRRYDIQVLKVEIKRNRIILTYL